MCTRTHLWSAALKRTTEYTKASGTGPQWLNCTISCLICEGAVWCVYMWKLCSRSGWLFFLSRFSVFNMSDHCVQDSVPSHVSRPRSCWVGSRRSCFSSVVDLISAQVVYAKFKAGGGSSINRRYYQHYKNTLNDISAICQPLSASDSILLWKFTSQSFFFSS